MLCDTCFWKLQCQTYVDLKHDQEINKCVDEYGGIEYVKQKR